MVGVRAVAVAEVPYRIFHALSRSHGGHSVHRHCAAVHECHIETTLCRRYLVSHQGQGEACAGKGAHGELARGVVDEGEVAEVGDVVVRRHGDFLTCRQSLRGVVGGVPPVVESRGHGEVVFLDDAAAGRHHTFVSAFEGEVGIAVVGTFVAVARCQADVDGLTRVGSQVDADGGPVFPEHIIVGLVPPHVVVGDEVGASAGRVHYRHVLVEQLEAEARLHCRAVHGVLEHRRITHDKEVEIQCVDRESVHYGLCFGGPEVGAPVAQTHGGGGAIGHGFEQTS